MYGETCTAKWVIFFICFVMFTSNLVYSVIWNQYIGNRSGTLGMFSMFPGHSWTNISLNMATWGYYSASFLFMSETVMGKFWSWFTFNKLLNNNLEGNPIEHCIILAASAPSILDLWNIYILFFEYGKEILSVNIWSKYISVRSIKKVQSFASMVKIEYGIWASVEKIAGSSLVFMVTLNSLVTSMSVKVLAMDSEL